MYRPEIENRIKQSSMIGLRESGVIFDEENHTYELNGKKLSGITKLVDRLKCHGESEKMIEKLGQEYMNSAAEKGSRVHKACENADVMGIEFVSKDLLEEVEAYFSMRESVNCERVENEYTVTDGKYWASNIDFVWAEKGNKKEVVLADAKTTYNIHKTSLEWQLSIYAYMFEHQNPGIKVSKLYCVLLFKPGQTNAYGMRKIVEVERKPDEEVAELLTHVDYMNEPIPEEPETQNGVELDLSDLSVLAEIDAQMKELKAKSDSIKEAIKAKMEQAKSFDCEYLKISYIAPTKKETFDSTRFKKEQSEIYRQYIKTSETVATIRVTYK